MRKSRFTAAQIAAIFREAEAGGPLSVEAGNAKLKRMYADRAPENAAIKDVLS